MGRLIDADYIDERIEDELGIGADRQLWYEEIINDAPTVEAIPKAEYENRLKADMVAMLTEIQLEIEEREQYYQDEFLKSKNAVHDAAMGGRMFGCGDCKEIIQQKINVLKAEKEDT